MAERHSQPLTTFAVINVGVGIGVFALKYAAYYLTGSIAIYSDALESVINVITAAAALVAVWLSAKPADSNHPYGHTKAEYFSAVLDGVLVVVAAISIFREAFLGFRDPQPFAAPLVGILIVAVATLANGVWSYILHREGKRRRSPALVADAIHIFTDVITSVGVIVGLVLTVVTGWAILDPILAAIVAVNILWSGWRLMRESVGGLMDEAVPANLLDRIRGIIAASGAGALEAHDLRTRSAGRVIFIDFHLVVPGTMTVAAAHAICDQIERSIRAAVDDAQITIHVEPEEKAKHHGVVVL